MILKFSDIQLDCERFELRQNGQLISVEPLIFNLLTFLAQHSGRVFSRDALIDQIWNGRVVSDSTVSSAIKSARKVLGDDGKKQRFIQTVHGRGFRFIAEVESTQQQNANHSSRQFKNKTPSLTLLPFRVITEDNDQFGNFANALVTRLGTILTRVPLLKISDYGFESQTQPDLSARNIYEHLGVKFVIGGDIQNIDNQTRVNVHLTDTHSGFRLWAEHFELENNNICEFVITLLSKLEPQINRAIFEYIRNADGPPNAQELYLHASSILSVKGWHQSTFTQAADLLRQSQSLDHEFALPVAYLSLVLALGHRVGLIDDIDQARCEALEAVDKALDLDNVDSTVLGFTGCALADLGLFQRAIPLLKNAIDINSTNAQAWAALGSAYLLTDELDLAIENLQHGIKISPLDSRLSIWQTALALAFLRAKNFSKAKKQAELACQRDDRTYLPRLALAAIHALLEDGKSAQLILEDAYRIKPDLSRREIKAVIGARLCNLLIN